MVRFSTYIKSLLIISISVMLLIFSLLSSAQTLRIGTITNTPVDEIRVYQYLADYLSQQLAGDGIHSVEIKMAADIDQMVNLLKHQEIDLFIDSSLTALIINQQAGSKYLLRRWKKGRASYRSVIAVRADSDIYTPAELKNQTIVFEEPFSTSGFILPSLSLIKYNISLTDNTYQHDNQLVYRFGYDNETQITWLERGKVQAAAMSEADFNDLASTALTPLRILLTTAEVPYHVVVHRSGLDKPLITRLKMVLQQADQSKLGRVMLQQFERTTRFDDIPQSLLNNMQTLKQYLESLPTTQE